MKLDQLLKKRARLDQKIEAEKKVAQRKSDVAELAAKAKILDLPDEVLAIKFKQIADEFSHTMKQSAEP
jgi:hypothetical protein